MLTSPISTLQLNFIRPFAPASTASIEAPGHVMDLRKAPLVEIPPPSTLEVTSAGNVTDLRIRPRVSIVIPVFNAGKDLPEAVESVVTQTFQVGHFSPSVVSIKLNFASGRSLLFS